MVWVRHIKVPYVVFIVWRLKINMICNLYILELFHWTEKQPKLNILFTDGTCKVPKNHNPEN